MFLNKSDVFEIKYLNRYIKYILFHNLPYQFYVKHKIVKIITVKLLYFVII